jgi:succinylglutamate desuccinylase
MQVIKNPDGISGVNRIESGKPGPRVLIFGGTHGNEVSGVQAVRHLLSDFVSGTYTLVAGVLTLVEANEQGIAQDRWYIKRDLNELFKNPPEEGDTYEYTRAEELKPLLKNTDYFLDLHSTPIGKTPFVVVEEHNVDAISHLGITKMVTGWSTMEGADSSGDAENYAIIHGATAATVESGDDEDPKVGYEAVLRLLTYLKMSEPPFPPQKASPEIYLMYFSKLKESDDFAYTGEPDNFKFIRKGEPYAIQQGAPLLAPEDSYLVMPHIPENTAIGEKMCYLARKVP